MSQKKGIVLLNRIKVNNKDYPPPYNKLQQHSLSAPLHWTEFFEGDKFLKKKDLLKLNYGINVDPLIKEFLRYKLRRIILPPRWNDTPSPNKIGEVWLSKTGDLKLIYDFKSRLILSDLIYNPNIAYDRAMKPLH